MISVREHSNGLSYQKVYEKVRNVAKTVEDTRLKGCHLDCFMDMIQDSIKENFNDVFECELCGDKVDVTLNRCDTRICNEEDI